jgi:ElaB/YqjD/DUF883 family membrane-anchored ribosome-binding protein
MSHAHVWAKLTIAAVVGLLVELLVLRLLGFGGFG